MQAIRGGDLALLRIDDTTPDDVRLMHDILLRYKCVKANNEFVASAINTANCGTAMRFLTAFFAQEEGADIVLDGSERMRERPIGQLVDALRELGAEIDYVGAENYPPLRIKGHGLSKKHVTLLHPLSSQFVSALLLIGAEVNTDCQSPYINMTKQLILSSTNSQSVNGQYPLDWSAAAFWYEWVALHGGELLLENLCRDSLQGDSVVAEVFEHLGVETEYIKSGVLIRQGHLKRQTLTMDFSNCPDLYPAVFATCHRLGVAMSFSGLESLPLKESNRLQAMQQIEDNQKVVYSSFADHRIAMALLAADYKVDDTDCIKKSYPMFVQQWKQLLRS